MTHSDKPTSRRIRRQALGLRPGLEPYYLIHEQSTTRLVLHSRPRANAGAGRLFGGCGAVLALLSLCVLSGSYTEAEDFNSVLAGLIAALPCGIVGSLGLIAGLAIGTTSNTITVDTEQRTLVYSQSNRLARTRNQTLHLDQIAHLRLQSRSFKPPGPFRQPRSIVALEFVTNEEFVWLVDSAAEAEALEPVVSAMSQLLELQVACEIGQEKHDTAVSP